MISVQDAVEKFKSILTGYPTWAKLAKSQFVNFLAIFMGWALRDSLWKVERAKQEFFLATALNDASVRAHAEGREYVPRKATPSTGTVRVTNTGTATAILPGRVAMTSDKQVEYLLESPIAVAAGQSVDVGCSQLSYATPLVVGVNFEIPFFQIVFPREVIGRVSRYRVMVDQGDGYREWRFARLFFNCSSSDTVYDEYYTHTGQYGLRFGNGQFGKMPPAGAKVMVEYWTTDGYTSLMAGQKLYPSAELTDINGEAAALTFEAVTAIEGGSPAETVAEMRVNLHYWAQYADKVVWGEDYAFYIRKAVSGITWLNVWGEQQQEAESGFSVQNINKIFVSGYAPGNGNLAQTILAALSSLPLLNRKFQWVDPVPVTFAVQVSGTISRSIPVATAIADIKSLLANNYGADSNGRLPSPELSDLYRLLDDTGYFSGGRYQITVSGTTEATLLAHMLSIDIEGSTFNLAYA